MTLARANAMALMAALAWGLGNVSQKTILDHLDGFSATGLTSFVGALVLLPFLRRETRMAMPPTDGSFGLVLTIALLFTLASTVMQFGYGHTSVTNAGFLSNTAAAMTPIIGWVCFAQRPQALIWLACLCTLTGVFLMAGGNWAGQSFGDGLALCAAVAFAFWTLFLGKYAMQFRRPIFVTVVQLLTCGVICMVTAAFTYGLPSFDAVVAALPEIMILGAVSKGLAYVLNATAQQHIPAACAAVIISAEAVFGSLAAMLFLGESLSFGRALGAACILVGVVIASSLPGSEAATAALVLKSDKG